MLGYFTIGIVLKSVLTGQGGPAYNPIQMNAFGGNQ
jgi:hypothetical protein